VCVCVCVCVYVCMYIYMGGCIYDFLLQFTKELLLVIK